MTTRVATVPRHSRSPTAARHSRSSQPFVTAACYSHSLQPFTTAVRQSCSPQQLATAAWHNCRERVLRPSSPLPSTLLPGSGSGGGKKESQGPRRRRRSGFLPGIRQSGGKVLPRNAGSVPHEAYASLCFSDARRFGVTRMGTEGRLADLRVGT